MKGCLKILPHYLRNEFDFITLWGVLEHLHDPLSTIQTLQNLLTKTGKIAITTIDSEGIIPYYYKPIEHLSYWTLKSFEILFEKCNLELISHEPYVMFQRAEIYLDRLLSRTPNDYKQAFSEALTRLPKYVEVPTNEVFVIAQQRTSP